MVMVMVIGQANAVGSNLIEGIFLVYLFVLIRRVLATRLKISFRSSTAIVHKDGHTF